MNYLQMKAKKPELSASRFGINTDGLTETAKRAEERAKIASLANAASYRDQTFTLLLSHGNNYALIPITEATDLRQVQMDYTAKHDILNRDLNFSSIYHQGSCIASITPNGRLDTSPYRAQNLSDARAVLFGPSGYLPNGENRYSGFISAIAKTDGWHQKFDAAAFSVGAKHQFGAEDASAAMLDLLKGQVLLTDWGHHQLGPLYAEMLVTLSNTFPDAYQTYLSDIAVTIERLVPALSPHLPKPVTPPSPTADTPGLSRNNKFG